MPVFCTGGGTERFAASLRSVFATVPIHKSGMARGLCDPPGCGPYDASLHSVPERGTPGEGSTGSITGALPCLLNVLSTCSSSAGKPGARRLPSTPIRYSDSHGRLRNPLPVYRSYAPVRVSRSAADDPLLEQRVTNAFWDTRYFIILPIRPVPE